MKRESIIAGTLIVLLFGSCNSGDRLNSGQSEVVIGDEQSQSAETEPKKKEERAIKLNDGEKWKVNDEMLPHIEKSESIYEDFEGGNYQKLSKEMMAVTNILIQSCTMTGSSHDELHKWLHPHIELIKRLGKGDTESEKAFEDLAVSFEIFHTYFE